MRQQLLVRGVTVALLVLGTAAGAVAGSATDQLKPQLDQVLATIDDPALRAESKTAERRQAIRAITDGIFDWTEMARRSLGRHWEERTVTEQTEFVALFRDLLERAFVGKIERYGAENVAYVGESLEGDETTVRTLVTLKPGPKVGVDYRMAQQGTRWVIYDVVIQAISLVSNYRTQFESVLKTSPYQKLLTKLRAKAS
jgi:phospholipid transport system substrate-binding protein